MATHPPRLTKAKHPAAQCFRTNEMVGPLFTDMVLLPGKTELTHPFWHINTNHHDINIYIYKWIGEIEYVMATARPPLFVRKSKLVTSKWLLCLQSQPHEVL